MRVLHLSWEYPPVLYGGLGRHVHALAETQAARGDDVVVITQSIPGHPEDEVVNGVRVIRVQPTAPEIADWRTRLIEWSFGFNVAVTRAAISLVREWRPEVIHGHDWLVAPAAVLVRDASLVPFVLTVHATESGRSAGALVSEQSRAIDSTEEWAAHQADAVIVCSDFMRTEVASAFRLDPEGIAVIPNGIDPDRWQAAEARRRSMRREYGTPLVVYTGRLEVEKGVQTLLDAMPLVRMTVPDARAVVAGEGSASRGLRARARRRRLGDAVRFAGHVSEADLRALVSAANAAVVPSLYEPFGLVALEAAVMGAPLIVSRTGGLADIVEDGRTGWQYAPGDAAALATVLAEALSDPRLARRRAAAARSDVVARYAWPAIADSTAEVYGRTARG